MKMVNSKILFIFLGVLLSLQLNAQRDVKLGNKYFKSFDFINAVDFYKKALDKNAENLEATRGLAYSYKYLNDSYNSAFWFEKLVPMEKDSSRHLFELAQAQRANQSYNEALLTYNDYMARVNEDFVSEITGNGFDYIQGLKGLNPDIQLNNAETLNSKASDFGVSFKRYNEIVYCSTRDASEGEEDNWTHEKYADLYESSVSFDQQSDPVKFMENMYNGIYHDGPVSFFRNEMYLTRSNYFKKKTKKSKGDNTVKLQLHKVDISKGEKELKKPVGEKLVFNDREYSVAHAALSPDGKSLVFTADAPDFPDYQGGTDLYICTRANANNDWSAPKSLGNLVNTPADEEYPFFASNDLLYFASDGHYGMGGLDIYSIQKGEDSTWSDLTNIGAPFNTGADDFNYVFNPIDELGFITSNRDGGLGSDDIYVFKGVEDSENPLAKGKKQTLDVLVYDAETKEPIEGATITIPDCYDDEWLSDDRGILSTDIDDNLPCELFVEAPAYNGQKVPFVVMGDNVKLAVPLDRKPEAPIQLQVCVYDQFTRNPIPNATVVLYNEDEDRNEEVTTDAYGCVMFDSINPNTCYHLVGQKMKDDQSGYLSTTGEQCTYGVKGPTLLQQQLYLMYGSVGSPLVSSSTGARTLPNGIVLPIIYYDLDKFNIRTDAAEELTFLLKVMQDNPSLKIKAASHTDCRRDVQYNMTLSKNRAIEAVDWLVEHGINENRLTWQNYGESQHVNDCDCECDGSERSKGLGPFRDCEDAQLNPSICTEDEHQLNRRTEFVVVSF